MAVIIFNQIVGFPRLEDLDVIATGEVGFFEVTIFGRHELEGDVFFDGCHRVNSFIAEWLSRHREADGAE
ncbi:uncharacterized protein METZ01_LOCUS345748, partial [marine metagenome]